MCVGDVTSNDRLARPVSASILAMTAGPSLVV